MRSRSVRPNQKQLDIRNRQTVRQILGTRPKDNAVRRFLHRFQD
jgi:hypothetical protein